MSAHPLKIDDFLDTASWQALLQYFKDSVAFRYGWSSDKEVSEFAHWNCDFLGGAGVNQANLEARLYANPAQVTIAAVWTRLKEFHLKGHALVRCYANQHTYGVEGAPHIDSREDGNYTTILYIVPEWKAEWAGETVFFNDEGDIVESVLPKPNRAITFNGTQLHSARSLARICPNVRTTLMFKTVAPAIAAAGVTVNAPALVAAS